MIELTSKFETTAKELADKFRRPTVVSAEEIRESDSFKHKIEGITSEPKKRGGRTDEAIEADCMTGQAAEIGVARLLGAEVFDTEWNVKDRSTYAKDVIYDGLRIEVKSHKHLRRFAVINHSFNTMMKSWAAREFDLLVFAHVERLNTSVGHFSVSPTLIVDPYPTIIEFRQLWDPDEFSQVYRADLAYTRFLCHPLIDLE